MDPGVIAAIGQSLGDYFKLVDNFLFGERDALIQNDASVLDRLLNPFIQQRANDNTNLYLVGGLAFGVIIVAILFFTTIKKS